MLQTDVLKGGSSCPSCPSHPPLGRGLENPPGHGRERPILYLTCATGGARASYDFPEWSIGDAAPDVVKGFPLFEELRGCKLRAAIRYSNMKQHLKLRNGSGKRSCASALCNGWDATTDFSVLHASVQDEDACSDLYTILLATSSHLNPLFRPGRAQDSLDYYTEING